MSRRRQERAALRELQRRVWGDRSYERHLADLAREKRRRISLVAILGGVQMLIIAVGLFAFAGSASAHTAEITIGCTQVQFNYSQFPETSASATETIDIDGQPGLVRIFKFDGPSATDVVKIVLTGSGTHTVDATTHWTFFGQPQGSAEDSQVLKDCNPPTSTSTSTSTTVTESTTVPKTTTSMPATTTTSMPVTTTTSPPPTTTITISPETTSSVPVGPSGSTTSTLQGVTTTIAAPPPTASLPFTGSSTRTVSIGFAIFGLGLIGLGAGSRRARD